MTEVVLSVPKRQGRKTLWVRATLSDYWKAACDDGKIAARLEELKPEWTQGYLPPPTVEWARTAERVLSARIESITPDPAPAVPGTMYSFTLTTDKPWLYRLTNLETREVWAFTVRDGKLVLVPEVTCSGGNGSR